MSTRVISCQSASSQLDGRNVYGEARNGEDVEWNRTVFPVDYCAALYIPLESGNRVKILP